MKARALSAAALPRRILTPHLLSAFAHGGYLALQPRSNKEHNLATVITLCDTWTAFQANCFRVQARVNRAVSLLQVDSTMENGTSQGASDAQNDAAAGTEPPEHRAGFLATADQLPLVPWGHESAPMIPSVDTGDESDHDSALGSFVSSTASLNPNIYDYVVEHGRTYHRYKQGKYHFPNDLDEQDRLEVQHALFLLTTQGRLYLAPISSSIQRVLDIGTGTGVWAVEFAEQFPGTEVIGTDLSPIQPQYVPPNCCFEIDDAEDPWVFGAKFDYVHARAMCSCFSDHKSIISKCYDALAPGGWCEWQDVIFPFQHVGPIPEGTTIVKWTELIVEAAERLNRPWHNSSNYKRYFEEAGFQNVTERKFYWPVGMWPRGEYYKNIAAYFVEDIHKVMDIVTLKLLPALGWSFAEMQVLLTKVREDLTNPNIHAYLDVTFVYGQKPS